MFLARKKGINTTPAWVRRIKDFVTHCNQSDINLGDVLIPPSPIYHYLSYITMLEILLILMQKIVVGVSYESLGR